MKRSFVCVVLVVLSVILAGCGKGDGTSEEDLKECRNLKVERTDFPKLWMYGFPEDDRDFIQGEKIPYFKKIVEEARHLPLRPAPLLDIIYEESEDYFNGNKSAEEVAEIIENRVMLYLNERR